MTRDEFLKNKFAEDREKYTANNMAFYKNPSIAQIDPFMIADGLYYVGDRKVCIHLIDTGEGLILIDSGYLGATHLLVDSIWRAGFDPRNVVMIIHTHGHSDHFGASDEFSRLYGTKLAISRIDAEYVRSIAVDGMIGGTLYPLAKMPEFDYEMEDGDVIEVGSVKIRCVLTPGHTLGVMSLFFDVTYEGKTYTAGLFGGAGVNALKLTYMHCKNMPLDLPEQMLASIEKVRHEPVTVHLGNHPSNNATLARRERQLKEGGNPFINENSWTDFLDSLKAKAEKAIADREALNKEMDETCDG